VQEVILGAAEAQALKHMHRELLLEGLIALESFRHAKLYVPIYPDTRKEDLDWKQIGRLQKKVYRTKRRAREDKYEKYLSAFDLFHEKHKSPNQIARILGLPLDQVRRAIRTAYRDILGQTPEKRTGATFEEHSKTCPHFKAGQMCKHCNRLLNADVGLASDWRERRVRGGIADTLYNPARGGKHIRKKQASFPEDEVPAK